MSGINENHYVAPDGTVYEAVEQLGCEGCVAFMVPGHCNNFPPCQRRKRKDARNIVWRKVKSQTERNEG